MTHPLNIALLQCNPLCGAIEANTKMLIKHIKHHQTVGTHLICTPELALCGYPPEDLLLRPAFHEAIKTALKQLCEILQGETALLVGYPHQNDEDLTNRMSLIQYGKIQQSYDKRCLPNYDTFDEKRYFTPGNKPAIITLKGHRLGLLICEDVWSDSIVTETVQCKTDALIIINASPYAMAKNISRLARLKKISQTHSQTCCYINLVGGQDELVFDGRSFVIDPSGQCCLEGKAFSEDTLLYTLTKKNKNPDIKRQASINADSTLYQALVYGVQEYVRKNHFPGVLIGLSGGIDSALTLAIATDALGKERVHAVMMPTQYTSTNSLEDARLNAKALGVLYTVIDIEPLFQIMKNTLNPHFKGKPADTTEENLQARIRGMLLMGLSNKHGNLLLCTGNKSEMSVGYSTLYGDLAGGFCPLKDIFKTTVYRLCRYRNSISEAIPKRIIQKAPSAELATDQRDDDTLPPYPILDAILKRYIHAEQAADTIIELGFDAHSVNDIIKRINTNEFKRRQTAIGIRVSERAFGRDRRYPITMGSLTEENT